MDAMSPNLVEAHIFLGGLENLVINNKLMWYNGEQEHSDVANLIYYIEEIGYALDPERFERRGK